MNSEEYSLMYKIEDIYWWFVARRKMLSKIITIYLKSKNNKILDIGCGTGSNLLELSKFGDAIGIDRSDEAIDFCHKRGLQNVSKEDAETFSFEKESFDLITVLDVLEHVQEDIKLLEKCYDICKVNGLLFITVPAYGFLWSEHDEALHHKRRYTASELRNKLNLVNFKIVKISYNITSLFFVVFFFRFWQNLFKKSVYPQSSVVLLPEYINNILIKILDIETFFLKYINFPFGVSIVCVATKE